MLARRDLLLFNLLPGLAEFFQQGRVGGRMGGEIQVFFQRMCGKYPA
ncbi:hypothetical protein [Rheinheimera texasensis]